jgi:hypothetical protein
MTGEIVFPPDLLLANVTDDELVAIMGSLYVPRHVPWLRSSFQAPFLCSRALDGADVRTDVLPSDRQPLHLPDEQRDMGHSPHVTGEKEAFRAPARPIVDVVPNAVVEPICSLLLIQPFFWKFDLFEARFTTLHVM